MIKPGEQLKCKQMKENDTQYWRGLPHCHIYAIHQIFELLLNKVTTNSSMYYNFIFSSIECALVASRQ